MRFAAFAVLLSIGAASWLAMAQNTPPDAAKEPLKTEPATTLIPKPAIPPQGELEKRFAESLTNVVLEGTWQMTGQGGLTGNAPLTEPRPERYTITKATKTYEDYWVIQARIQYGDKDVTFPVPVRVVWAEDTPIITVNDLPVPGIGTYSARVMFFAGFYSGTWFSTAKNYGGVLSGRITPAAKAESSTAPTSEKPKTTP